MLAQVIMNGVKIILDMPPFFKWYGAVFQQPPKEAKIGDVVESIFHCAHPRNQFYSGENGASSKRASFMSVEKLFGHTWVEILDDSGWDTKFIWKRAGIAESLCTVQWSIGETYPVSRGTYRLKYFGRHNIFSFLGEHEGATEAFIVS